MFTGTECVVIYFFNTVIAKCNKFMRKLTKKQREINGNYQQQRAILLISQRSSTAQIEDNIYSFFFKNYFFLFYFMKTNVAGSNGTKRCSF